MKIPGPDHPITIAPHQGHVRVLLGDVVVAETDRALALQEASYPRVLYIPRADARMDLFTPTSRRTTCPYKGEASYFTLHANSRSAENAVWSYETPYPAVAAIAGHLAFYPNMVTINAG